MHLILDRSKIKSHSSCPSQTFQTSLNNPNSKKENFRKPNFKNLLITFHGLQREFCVYISTDKASAGDRQTPSCFGMFLQHWEPHSLRLSSPQSLLLLVLYEYFRAVGPAEGRGKEPPILCPPAPGCRGWGAGDPSPDTLSQQAVDLGPLLVSRGAQPMMKWSIWAEPCWFTYLLRHLWLLEIPFKIQCSQSAPCTVDSG